MDLEHFTNLDLVHRSCIFVIWAAKKHAECSLRALLTKIALIYHCICIAVQQAPPVVAYNVYQNVEKPFSRAVDN